MQQPKSNYKQINAHKLKKNNASCIVQIIIIPLAQSRQTLRDEEEIYNLLYFN